jgi:hypothetical protein
MTSKEKAIEKLSLQITALYRDRDCELAKHINAYDIVDIHVQWLFFYLCSLSITDGVPIEKWIKYVNGILDSMKEIHKCK